MFELHGDMQYCTKDANAKCRPSIWSDIMLNLSRSMLHPEIIEMSDPAGFGSTQIH